MGLVRSLFLAATLIAGFMADGQTLDMDNMTPDQIAEALGIPTDDQEYQAWLESDPANLLHLANGNPLVRINISIRDQRIHMVSPEGELTAKISSGEHDHNGRGPHRSARGCYRPYKLRKMHYSRKYDLSPMPNSVFYYKGFAIHATSAVRSLGRPASHGCIRVNLPTSKAVFDTVTKYGSANTLVCVY